MDRVNEPNAEADKFGAGKNGYTEGDPGITPRTTVGADALNAFQEEIVRTIEGAGLTPDAADLGQLYEAISKLITDGPPCASYEIQGSAVASGSRFTLAQSFKGATPASIYTLGSNKVTVADEGLYRVTLHAHVKSSDTSNPLVMAMIVSSDQGNAWVRATRFSATANDAILFSASMLFYLDAGNQIWLEPSSSSGNYTVQGIGGGAEPSQFSLERVSKF